VLVLVALLGADPRLLRGDRAGAARHRRQRLCQTQILLAVVFPIFAGGLRGRLPCAWAKREAHNSAARARRSARR